MKKVYAGLISVVALILSITVSYASSVIISAALQKAIEWCLTPITVNEDDDEYAEAYQHLFTVWQPLSTNTMHVDYDVLSSVYASLLVEGVPCQIVLTRGASPAGYVIRGSGAMEICNGKYAAPIGGYYFSNTEGQILIADRDSVDFDGQTVVNVNNEATAGASIGSVVTIMTNELTVTVDDTIGKIQALLERNESSTDNVAFILEEHIFSYIKTETGLLYNVRDALREHMPNISSYLSSIKSNTSILSSINAALTSIDNKISLDGTLNIDASSSNSNVSLSSASLSPVVSAIDNLRVEMAGYFTYTDFYSDTIEYYVPSSYVDEHGYTFPGSLYIPLPAGSCITDYSSVDTPEQIMLLTGQSFCCDLQPDGITTLSFNFPCSVTLGTSSDGNCYYTVNGVPQTAISVIPIIEYGSGTYPLDVLAPYESFWPDYYGYDFLQWLSPYEMEPFFSAGGMTIVNYSSSEFVVDVDYPVSEPWNNVYSSVESVASELDAVNSRLSTIISKLGTGTSGSVDLTTIEATLSTISDKLDNTASSVENTVINITNDNDAYNVFYIEDESGDTQSVTDFAGDLTGASGKLLSLLYRLVFADALDSVDSDLDNLEEFFTSEEPVLETASVGDNATYEVVTDVWATS